MARLLLRQPIKGHNAGEIIFLDARRANQLVLDKIGVLAPPKPPRTTLERLTEVLLQFRVGLDSLEFTEEEESAAKDLLQKAITPILPAFMPVMTRDEAGELKPLNSELPPQAEVVADQQVAEETVESSNAQESTAEPAKAAESASPKANEAPAEKPISRMNHDELVAKAESLGITEIPEKATNADIKKLIEAKAAESA